MNNGKDKLEKRNLLKEDPVAHTITITLGNPSGNLFLEFVGSMSIRNMSTIKLDFRKAQSGQERQDTIHFDPGGPSGELMCRICMHLIQIQVWKTSHTSERGNRMKILDRMI